MKRSFLFVIVLIKILLLTQPEQTAIASSGKIAFKWDKDGNADIYIIDEDGRNLQQFTFHDASDNFPAWFPDGRHIAFSSSRDGYGIYRMKINGTNLKRLNDRGGHFAISPDGQWIAVDDSPGLLLVNLDGVNQRKLRWGLPVGFTNMPAWSPDGKQIAFTIRLPGVLNDIYVIDVTGENLRQLTKDPAQDLYPAWSPDGRRIAFFSTGIESGIYVMDADGANLMWLANGTQPAWSPDGRRIAFVSTQDGKFGIFIMDADGGNIKLLVEGGGEPAWWGPSLAVSAQGKLETLWGRIKQGVFQ